MLAVRRITPHGAPVFTRGEEAAHSALHGLAAALAIPAIVVLVVVAARGGDAASVAGYAVFGASLLTMFGSSSVYHGLADSPAKRVMRILDYDFIYVLIAGTYTAYCVTALRDGSGGLILFIVWTLAAVGIAIRTAFPDRFRAASLACYLAMGWIIALFFGEVRQALPTDSLRLLYAGGIAYSAGAVFYVLDRVPWFHAVWHVFVMAGAACHLFSVLGLPTA